MHHFEEIGVAAELREASVDTVSCLTSPLSCHASLFAIP